MKKFTMVLASMMALGITTSAIASEGHDHMKSQDMSGHEMSGHEMKNQMQGEHGAMNHGDMKMDMSSPAMFLVKKEIDGYTVSFHVMPAKADMQHGGSHNVMIKVEKGGVALNDVVINSKVFLPNKSTDSKMLMKMGDWYMAGYDLDATGKNGIMILFKTADGQKHKGSVYYPEAK